MNGRDAQYLVHMQAHCRDVAAFIQRFGNSYEAFISDRAYYNAVAMCIMQIGELSNGLSQEYRDATKDRMPWSMIRGMRNWLAHSYGEIDAETLWRTACDDIPKVLSFCNQELTQLK